ncbi:MAG: putative glycoside hydrolase [Patescibacteria group bacterium]|nr:putative glycoside hydrolase [Patescibacteria group bacterium]
MKIKRMCLLLLIAIIAGGCGSIIARKAKLGGNPKLAAYWTSPTMTKDEADSLANFHLVVADMENLVNNPDNLRAIKKRNPEVKLLAYSNPMELFYPMVANRTLQKEVLEKVEAAGKWWLLQPDGEPVIFWPGMRMLNLSAVCPEVNGARYNRWIARFLLEKVLFNSVWDGYFMDNSGGDVSWIGTYGRNKGIDSGNNGENDDTSILDFSWSLGIQEFLRVIREAKGPNFLMVGNKGTLEFLNILDGKMFEEFPNDYLGDDKAGGWYKSMTNYFQTGPFSIIQARQVPNNPEHRLFILSSALLFDGYYAYGQGLIRRFPEYQEIGKALGPAREMLDGSWQREFSKAIVKVWPGERKGEIIYKSR